MSSTAPPPETAWTGLVHEAFPYHDDREFLLVVLPYVRTALAADQAVLVELPGPRGDLVRAALATMPRT